MAGLNFQLAMMWETVLNRPKKGTQNIQAHDMNSFGFLFEFQSRKAAEPILVGD